MNAERDDRPSKQATGLRTHIRRAATAIAAVTMLLVTIAALAKAADLETFRQSLDSWTFLPPTTHAHVTVMVPVAEVIIVTSFFIGFRRQTATIACAAMLLLFTAMHVGQISLGVAPDCNCFGKLLAHERTIDAAWSAVARNTGMIALLLPAIFVGFWPENRANQSDAAPARDLDPPDLSTAHTPGAQSAFTLLETLVVVAIVATLIAILLPALSHIRDASRDTSDLADLRSQGMALAAFSADHDDEFLSGSDPNNDKHTFGGGSQSVVAERYFDFFFYWPLEIVAEGYIDVLNNNEVFISAVDSNGSVLGDYRYPCTMIAAPDFYSDRRLPGRTQWRPTKQGEVLFPAAKALVARASPTRWDCPECEDEMAVFVDLSARGVQRRDVARGFVEGDGTESSTHLSRGLLFLHAVNGVRGMDVEHP